MNNTALILAEYLPADASKTSLPQRADHIRSLIQSADETWELHIGYICLLGRELLIAREQVGHGKFLAWIQESFPDYGERSLRRYMAFLADVAGKSQVVADIIRKPALLSNGEPDKAVLKTLCNAVAKVLDGKTMTAYLRDSGRCRELIHQKDRPNQRKQTPEEILADRKVNAVMFIDNLIAPLGEFCADHQLHADLETPKLKEFQDALLSAGRQLRDLLKARGKSKPAKKKGRK